MSTTSPEDENVPRTEPLEEPTRTRKSSRRLRDDFATLLAKKREAQLDELYSKPVEELEPEELRRMRSAFFRT